MILHHCPAEANDGTYIKFAGLTVPSIPVRTTNTCPIIIYRVKL
jgi:hypothetical protein